MEGKRDISRDDRSPSSSQPGRDRLVVRLFSQLLETGCSIRVPEAHLGFEVACALWC